MQESTEYTYVSKPLMHAIITYYTYRMKNSIKMEKYKLFIDKNVYPYV